MVLFTPNGPARQSRQTRVARLLVGLGLILVAAEPLGAQSLDIAVDGGQLATVSGRSESLRSVIEELCEAADVRLLYYDAEDRPLVAGYEDIPLHDLLPRLLKQESYLLGLRASDSGSGTRVATLRVIGENRSGSIAAAPPANLKEALTGLGAQRPAPAFQIPPALLRSSFNSENIQTRERAAKYVRERLLGNVGQTQRFVGIDADTLGRILRPYKHSGDILAKIRDGHDDPAVRIKLDEIIRAVERN
jgi:hypothetical protein